MITAKWNTSNTESLIRNQKLNIIQKLWAFSWKSNRAVDKWSQKYFPEIILKSNLLRLSFFRIAISEACNFGSKSELSQFFYSKC